MRRHRNEVTVELRKVSKTRRFLRTFWKWLASLLRRTDVRTSDYSAARSVWVNIEHVLWPPPADVTAVTQYLFPRVKMTSDVIAVTGVGNLEARRCSVFFFKMLSNVSKKKRTFPKSQTICSQWTCSFLCSFRFSPWFLISLLSELCVLLVCLIKQTHVKRWVGDGFVGVGKTEESTQEPLVRARHDSSRLSDTLAFVTVDSACSL